MTKSLITLTTIASLLGAAAMAEGDHNHGHAINQDDAILSGADTAKIASFDILAAHAHRKGNVVTFHMTTNGVAGADVPDATGAVGGANVLSYVWPPLWTHPRLALKAAPEFWRWREPVTRVLMIRRSMMKMVTVIREMTALSGTAIG